LVFGIWPWAFEITRQCLCDLCVSVTSALLFWTQVFNLRGHGDAEDTGDKTKERKPKTDSFEKTRNNLRLSELWASVQKVVGQVSGMR